MVTIREIAGEAGVSISTVSYVLNHPDRTDKASPETRKRIFELARRRRYTPNAFGRSLRTGRSFTVGILGQLGLYDSNVGNTLYGASEVLRNAGYNLELTQTGRMWQMNDRIRLAADADTPEQYRKKLADAADRLLTRGVDGILLVEVVNEQNAELFRALASRVPVVKVFSDSGLPEIPSVYVDPAAIGELAAAHLWELGHRRVLCLGGRAGTEERILDFWRRHGADGMAARIPGCRTFDDGRAVLHRLLREMPDATGIFAYNDNNAAGILYEAHTLGLRVPEDLSAVGVNNLELSEHIYPRLTTVELPAVRQGETAGELLIALMDGKSAADRILAPRLVRRESTGPARSAGLPNKENRR